VHVNLPGDAGWPWGRRLALCTLAGLLACAAQDASDPGYTEEQAASLCLEAESKLGDCFNVEVEFAPCDGTRAEDLLERSCTEIAESLAEEKSDDTDDWFCTTFPEVCTKCDADPDGCAGS
jgi:hypothetical protein